MHFRKAKYAFGGAFLLIIKKYSEKEIGKNFATQYYWCMQFGTNKISQRTVTEEFFYNKRFHGEFQHIKKGSP